MPALTRPPYCDRWPVATAAFLLHYFNEMSTHLRYIPEASRECWSPRRSGLREINDESGFDALAVHAVRGITVMVRVIDSKRWLLLPVAGFLFASERAEAIPAFVSQTGQPCTACQVSSFGPQLPPLGRAFKIGGYTQTGGEGWAARMPLSLMATTFFTNTSASVPGDQVAQHYAANNNFSLDQISGFTGGNIGAYSGGLIQFTWRGVANTSHVDNTDLRPFTKAFDIGGKELRLGITLNNTPTVQNPYNTTFARGFPFIASALAPAPTANHMLAGVFGGNAIGYTLYAWYDNSLYLEGGAYNTLGSWSLARIGNDYSIGSTTSPAPYLRAAYEWHWATIPSLSALCSCMPASIHRPGYHPTRQPASTARIVIPTMQSMRAISSLAKGPTV